MRSGIIELKALWLEGMAITWAVVGGQNKGGMDRSRWLVEPMLKAEASARARRSFSYQKSAAKFYVHRDLANLDCAFGVLPVDRVHDLFHGKTLRRVSWLCQG